MKIVNLCVANKINNQVAMPRLRENDTFPKTSLVIALGCFDGVHVGHRALLNLAIETAKENGYTSAALIISRSTNGAISTLEKRIELMEKMGIDLVIIEDFSQIRNMTKEEYISRLVVELNCKVAICGYNFSFGKNKEGDATDLINLMKCHSCDAKVVGRVELNGLAVSSSEIRGFLNLGEIEKANLLLGRPYSIEGEIIHGMGLGKHLGFPTINQSLCTECVHPKKGVYGGYSIIDGVKYKSITNIGVKPTVTKAGTLVSETHIIDFSGDIYGKSVKVNLLFFIRDERTFESMEELKKEVQLNIETVRNYQM